MVNNAVVSSTALFLRSATARTARRQHLAPETHLVSSTLRWFGASTIPTSRSGRSGQRQKRQRVQQSVSSPSFNVAAPTAIKQTQKDVDLIQRNATKERLDVAIVGAPNAGKSQLLNVLCGSTVAAVSRKRHTTRSGILGARTVLDQQKQIVFVDTPGFMRYKSARKEGLTRELMTSAETELMDVDYTLVVIDAARRLDDDLKEALATLMLRAAAASGRIEATMDDEDGKLTADAAVTDTHMEVVREKFAIVLNKVDLVEPKEKLLEIAALVGEMGDECVRYMERECPTYEEEQYIQDGDNVTANVHGEDEATIREVDPEILERLYPPVFYISALQEDGVDDVLNHLLSYTTPCTDWPVPANSAALMSPQERVEEVIREKIYRCLHREVPHQVRQINRLFRHTTHPHTGEKLIRIDQDLVVRTESHRRLVTGSGGLMLKRIETDAEKDMKKAFDCDVQLNLHVKFSKSRQKRNVDSERSGVIQRTL